MRNTVGADIREVVAAYGVIDAHAHIGFYKVFHTPQNGTEGLLRVLDRTGMAELWISSLVGLDADIAYGNDMVAAAVAAAPGRLCGYACVNPYEPALVLPELERCFRTLGMRAIKLHPQLNVCPEDSPLYEPVYAWADARGLAVLNHSWGSPANLRRVARQYPNMRILVAHYGSAWDGVHPNETLQAVRELPNVWVDTAGSGAYLGAIERTYEAVGGEKLVFGTDVPFLDASYQIGNVVYADIPEADKRRILRENFLTMLRK